MKSIAFDLSGAFCGIRKPWKHLTGRQSLAMNDIVFRRKSSVILNAVKDLDVGAMNRIDFDLSGAFCGIRKPWKHLTGRQSLAMNDIVFRRKSSVILNVVKDLNAKAMNRIDFDLSGAFCSIRKPWKAPDRSAKPCNE